MVVSGGEGRRVVETRGNNGRAIIMLIGRETTVGRLMGVFTNRGGGREGTPHPAT